MFIAADPTGRYSRTANRDSPVGCSSVTRTDVTTARDGPTRHHATSRSTASAGPSNTASTSPSSVLRTHPCTPAAAASRRAESRKNTPCTRPSTTTRLRTTATTPPSVEPGPQADHAVAQLVVTRRLGQHVELVGGVAVATRGRQRPRQLAPLLVGRARQEQPEPQDPRQVEHLTSPAVDHLEVGQHPPQDRQRPDRLEE